MLKYLFLSILLTSLVVKSSANDNKHKPEKPTKVIKIDKDLLIAIKVDDVWHEGEIIESSDSAILYKMNVVVYEKRDTTDEEGKSKRKYEAVTKDTVVTFEIVNITKLSVYKTAKVKARKRRTIMMWSLSVVSIALGPFAGPYAFVPIIASGLFVSIKYINPVKRISLKRKSVTFQ